jgi:hypothetical protein
MNTANASTGVGTTSSNEINHIPAATEPEIPEESGRSKRKRVPRQLADALNGCLCGLVLDGSLGGVLKCKQAGCETQWVSTLYRGCLYTSSDSTYVHSITSSVWNLSKSHEIGCAWLVRRRGEDAAPLAAVWKPVRWVL